MPSKIEIFDGLVESYSKNPEQGLKFCKKKLQKNPNDSTHLVSIPPSQYLVITLIIISWLKPHFLAN
jgi:hypothetical protein